MKIWHVSFTSFGFEMDAVVVHQTRGEAIALLKLTPDEKLSDAREIGAALGDLTARVVTEDKFGSVAR